MRSVAALHAYSLGILLDRDSDGKTGVEERFLFRPTILRAFGWRVIDIPVADWHRTRSTTIERIESELETDSWDMVKADPFAGVTLPSSLEAPTAPAPSPAHSALSPHSPKAETAVVAPVVAPQPEQPVDAAHVQLTEFRFVRGTSNKYWKVGVVSCDLIVEFGRVGTKGQRVIKTFEDEDRAKREATKLTLEKTRKGYEDFG